MRKLLVTAVVGIACQPTPPPPPTANTVLTERVAPSGEPQVPPSPQPPVPVGRWVPSGSFVKLSDDERGTVVAGKRIVMDARRATIIDKSAIEDLGRVRRLPDALSPGWIFLGKRSAHFSSSFTGTLRRIFNEPNASASGLRVGFGRGQLFVGGAARGAALYALPSGEKLPLPFKNTADLFGTPTGLVALRTEAGELFVSPSDGEPWKKLLSADAESLSYDGTGVVVDGERTHSRIGADGRLSPKPSEPGLTVSDNIEAFRDPWPDFSKPTQRADIDRLVEPLVVLLSDEVALRIEGTDLVLMDASSGNVIRTRAGFFRGHSNCYPIRGGPPAFVGCNDGAAMALFRIDGPDAEPLVERTFPGVYTQDFGDPSRTAPLSLARRCTGQNQPGALCVRGPKGVWQEPPRPADPKALLAQTPFLVHVAASDSGHVYAFGWLGGSGDLVIVDGRARKVRRIAKSALPAWASSGLRWTSLSLDGNKLRFLIEGDSPGVLVIHADDRVEGKALPGRVAAFGARALWVDKAGEMQKTLDGGKSFQPIVPPPGGAPSSGFFRCVETGCSIGPWHRVGWGDD